MSLIWTVEDALVGESFMATHNGESLCAKVFQINAHRAIGFVGGVAAGHRLVSRILRREVTGPSLAAILAEVETDGSCQAMLVDWRQCAMLVWDKGCTTAYMTVQQPMVMGYTTGVEVMSYMLKHEALGVGDSLEMFPKLHQYARNWQGEMNVAWPLIVCQNGYTDVYQYTAEGTTETPPAWYTDQVRYLKGYTA